MIDSSASSLIFVDYYPKYRIISGYNLYLHDFNVFNGTVNQANIPSTPLLDFKFSNSDGIFIDSLT